MEKLKRYIIFIIGLFISSIGVSMVTKADLGTSPISSIPYVLSLRFPFSLGEFTILFSLLLIVLQLIILRKNFKLEHMLQIPVSIVFGYFIDFSMLMLKFVEPQMYAMKLAYLLIGCVILGIGVYAEMLANVVMLPGESFVRAVVHTWKTDFGITKIVFDVSMSVTAGILSFVLLGKLSGVREGTVVAALLVGFIARFISKRLAFLPQKLFQARCTAAEEEDVMQPGICILIGRQYGSGGREIGMKLAEKYGFHFYDKETIQTTAGTTGCEWDGISENEEILPRSKVRDLLNQVYAFPENDSPKDNIFAAEAAAIEKIAAAGNAVIVGRCADYVLLDNAKCLSVFLFAPTKYRLARVMRTEGLSREAAAKKLRQMDRQRAEHYRYYTNQIWGMAANYHICIDTSFGAERVERIIDEALGYVG